MKKELLEMLRYPDLIIVRRAIILNSSLDEPIFSPKEIVLMTKRNNWDGDSLNWFLLKQFEGVGFEDCQEILGGNISEIPAEIGNLKNLKILRLSALVHEDLKLLLMANVVELNDFEYPEVEIPRSIGRLERLEELTLSGFNCVGIPDTIGSLKNLRKLDISQTNIRSIPETLGELSQLQELTLSGTQLSQLPAAIGKLVNLQYLDLSHLKALEALPETIGKLKNLKRMYCFRSGLRNIPETIGELKKLQEFELSYTKIAELPETVGKLNSLKELDLFGVEIEEWPVFLDDLAASINC